MIPFVLFDFVTESREKVADVSNVVAANSKDAVLQKGVGKYSNRTWYISIIG